MSIAMRLNGIVDGSKSIIKYVDCPQCLNGIDIIGGPYTHKEISSIINTSEWSSSAE